ncbi:MAG: hypothetical protein K0S07_1006 [Chlamydiales bacterium]|jgi:hypothetical protein|nr:hypothetical protein [Chlamydiales bacterium]
MTSLLNKKIFGDPMLAEIKSNIQDNFLLVAKTTWTISPAVQEKVCSPLTRYEFLVAASLAPWQTVYDIARTFFSTLSVVTTLGLHKEWRASCVNNGQKLIARIATFAIGLFAVLAPGTVNDWLGLPLIESW